MKPGKISKQVLKENDPLPVHSLEQVEVPVYVREIEYNNPYDFTREHRHDYFEILLFETGGGSQLIDFLELPVIASSCYIVFPQQVHLLKRGPSAAGHLLQFREEILPSSDVKNLLTQLSFSAFPAIFFENSPDKMEHLRTPLQLLRKSTESHSQYSDAIILHLLQSFLLMLLENREAPHKEPGSEDNDLLFRFRNHLENGFYVNHSVHQYAKLIATTEKKLSQITKKHLGLSPLQVIHNRLLLEAKRILLFEHTSHKEIAFRLGFDSPASFSQFIKNKTGLSPSELYSYLVDIHK